MSERKGGVEQLLGVGLLAKQFMDTVSAGFWVRGRSTYTAS